MNKTELLNAGQKARRVWEATRGKTPKEKSQTKLKRLDDAAAELLGRDLEKVVSREAILVKSIGPPEELKKLKCIKKAAHLLADPILVSRLSIFYSEAPDLRQIDLLREAAQLAIEYRNRPTPKQKIGLQGLFIRGCARVYRKHVGVSRRSPKTLLAEKLADLLFVSSSRLRSSSEKVCLRHPPTQSET